MKSKGLVNAKVHAVILSEVSMFKKCSWKIKFSFFLNIISVNSQYIYICIISSDS